MVRLTAKRFIIGDPPSAVIPAVDGAAHLYGFQFPVASTILLAATAFANLVDTAVPQSAGNAPAPANFLNSSMVSASRGNSRMARSFSSGKSGVGSSTTLRYSLTNSGSLKLLR